MQHKTLLTTIVISFMLFCLVAVGWARTDDMKTPCVNCHTMHSSQITGFGKSGIASQEALLNNSCYGCHTGTNQTALIWAAGPHRPFVNDTVMPEYLATGTEGGIRNTLAGGNFYWVGINDSNGHNVEGLDTQTDRQPPGGTKWFNDTTTPLTCAGVNGCHGLSGEASELKSMYQSHHADDTKPLVGVIGDLSQSYRFLDGVAGTEDLNWELSVDNANHNQYQGMARTVLGESDSKSISSLCARCHGDFHNDNIAGGSFASPWFRHPVDYDMAEVGEYKDYGLPSPAGTYVVETPLGSDNAVAGPVADVFIAAGNAIITCITCHRAHGSPYLFSLRWDYKNWPVSGYNGCGDCHTFKN